MLITVSVAGGLFTFSAAARGVAAGAGGVGTDGDHVFADVRFYRMSPLWAAALPVAAAFIPMQPGFLRLRYWLGRGGSGKGAPRRRQNLPRSRQRLSFN